MPLNGLLVYLCYTTMRRFTVGRKKALSLNEITVYVDHEDF